MNICDFCPISKKAECKHFYTLQKTENNCEEAIERTNKVFLNGRKIITNFKRYKQVTGKRYY